MNYKTVKADKEVVERVSEYNKKVRAGEIQGDTIVVSIVCSWALRRALQKRGIEI